MLVASNSWVLKPWLHIGLAWGVLFCFYSDTQATPQAHDIKSLQVGLSTSMFYSSPGESTEEKFQGFMCPCKHLCIFLRLGTCSFFSDS